PDTLPLHQHPTTTRISRHYEPLLPVADAHQVCIYAHPAVFPFDRGAGPGGSRRHVPSVAARRVGVGEVLDDDRAAPEQIGPNLHVLDDLLAKEQVWMRPIDAAVDNGHADTSPRNTELGPDPIGPDERNTLVEEIVELTVVVDRSDTGQADKAKNLNRGTPYADHREHPKRENLDAGSPNRRERECARVLVEDDDGLDELARRSGTECVPKNRVDLARQTEPGGRNPQ